MMIIDVEMYVRVNISVFFSSAIVTENWLCYY